ncbi:hypothetical protein AKO1_001862, partial [Acrasis kona]
KSQDQYLFDNAHEYRILYIKSLIESDALERSDSVRNQYALLLCKYYLEYLWYIVPNVIPRPETRLAVGKEPGLVGKLRREFLTFCATPAFRELTDPFHLYKINECLLALKEQKNSEFMHLLEERIVLCRHYQLHREAIFIIYFLLSDADQCITYCMEALERRRSREFFYEGTTNPFNLWIEMCFRGIDAKMNSSMNVNSIPNRLWDGTLQFQMLVRLQSAPPISMDQVQQVIMDDSDSTTVHDAVVMEHQQEMEIKMDPYRTFVLNSHNTAKTILNVYGRYFDIGWEEEGGVQQAQQKTIFDLIPAYIPCYELQDFFTKVIRRQQDTYRCQKLANDNLTSLQVMKRIQRAQLEARKKIINDKTRCIICQSEIAVGPNSSDINMYPESLDIAHTRCAKDYQGKPYPPHIHPKTLVNHMYHPIGIDDVVTIAKLEHAEPSKYFDTVEKETAVKRLKK